MEIFTKEFYDELDSRIYKAVADAMAGTLKEPSEQTKFLTRNQVCSLLSISLPTLSSYCDKGVLQKYKIGSRILFDEEEVQRSIRNIPVKFSFR